MGSTVPNFRIALEGEISSWRDSRKEYGAVGYAMAGLVGRLRGERLTAVISINL